MKNILVVGGSGFLGSALACALKERGLFVRVFDLKAHPDPSIESVIGDLRNPDQVRAACAGSDTVFQTASLVDWGPRSRERLFAINVQGNQNVIAACPELGVKRLIYTSSIDVVFDGRPINNGDETQPYPTRHLDDYGHSKMLAEQDVIAANGVKGLLTCSLRAAGIYGPGDQYRLPGVLKSLQGGQYMNIGNGTAKFGHVYVGNLVHAHILAAEAMIDGSSLAGQSYFIDDGQPQNFFRFFLPIISGLGYSPRPSHISQPLAYALASTLELLSRLGIGPQPPLLTRYIVQSTSQDFYFSHAKATRDFGYQPIVPPEQAIAETVAWLKQAGYASKN